MYLWRTLLFVPGDREEIVKKAPTRGADALILELEDGVHLDRKSIARELVANALKELETEKDLLVRVNTLQQGGEEDLKAIIPCSPKAVVLPKVGDVDELIFIERRIDMLEAQAGLKEKVRLLFQIETAMGILNMKELISRSQRVMGLFFGAEDYTADMNITRTPSGEELFYARSCLATIASAYHLSAIDTPYPDFRDELGLVHETEKILQMGFTGKAVIHPAQIKPIHRVFQPDPEEIEYATRILQAAREHNKAVFSLDGKMIDAPIIRRAELMVKRAESFDEA